MKNIPNFLLKMGSKLFPLIHNKWQKKFDTGYKYIYDNRDNLNLNVHIF